MMMMMWFPRRVSVCLSLCVIAVLFSRSYLSLLLTFYSSIAVILCLDCYYIPSTQMVDRFILAKIQLWYKRILFLKSFFPYFIVSTFISKYIYFIFLSFFVSFSLACFTVCCITAATTPLLCFGLFHHSFLLLSHFFVSLLFFLQILSSFSICQFRDFAIAKITFIYIIYTACSTIHSLTPSLSHSHCVCVCSLYAYITRTETNWIKWTLVKIINIFLCCFVLLNSFIDRFMSKWAQRKEYVSK